MLLRFFFRCLFLIFHCRDGAYGTEENFSRDLDFPWRHGRGGPSVSPLTWGTLTSVAIRVVVIGVWEATFAALRHCRFYISCVVTRARNKEIPHELKTLLRSHTHTRALTFYQSDYYFFFFFLSFSMI